MLSIIVLSGVSGAGKSTILHAFEEKGYRMIENIPNALWPALFTEIKSKPESFEKVVIVVEIRHALTAIRTVKKIEDINFRSIVLDCSKEELLKRFRLTRHVHPLQARGLSLEEGIEHDRRNIEEVRPFADIYLDTTRLSNKELRQFAMFALDETFENRMVVTFASFGYKYGVPQDADIVFDCRFLPNPFWIDELKTLTGLDQPVIDYLDSQKECQPYFEKMCAFLDHYLEECQKAGRNYIVIYTGCSGGQHRSVYFAEKLMRRFSDKYRCMLAHRELARYIQKDQ